MSPFQPPFWGYAVFWAFVCSLGSMALLMKANERKMHGLSQFAMIFGLACSAYILAAGVFLASNWTDPFAGKDTTDAAASHGGRGGLFILFFKFLPYSLILAGGYFGYQQFRILRILRSGAPLVMGK